MQDMDDESDDDEEDFGLSAETPPIIVTRNAELDWLVWRLYKEACHVDSADPESVVTELEAACAETEIVDSSSHGSSHRQQASGSVSKKELWTLLFEVKLKGDMQRHQYDQAVSHLTFDKDDRTREDALVDYESLCRYIVRMGRAFSSQVGEKRQEQEKIYLRMKHALLTALVQISSAGSR
jgi:hypothetical protein